MGKKEPQHPGGEDQRKPLQPLPDEGQSAEDREANTSPEESEPTQDTPLPRPLSPREFIQKRMRELDNGNT